MTEPPVQDRRQERFDKRASDDKELWDLLENAHETMERIDRHIDQHNVAGLKRRHFTNIFVRMTSLFLVVLTILSLYLLDQLDTSMKDIVENMGQMTGHFENVSGEMQQVIQHTGQMARHMDVMPSLQQHFDGITKEVAEMNIPVAGIDNNIGRTHGVLGVMDAQMLEMTGRFGTLNQGMLGIRHDMHNLAKPSRWMNGIMP